MCAGLFLSGCGTYTKYTRPEVHTDNLFGPDVEQTDTACIASMSWRQFFTDKKLQALIDSGLANNSDLRIAALRVEEAEASLVASRLAYLPQVQLVPQGQLGSYGGGKAEKTYSLALSAEWELDIAGRLTASERKAQADALQTRAARQAVETQLIATIANTYYNLLMLDAQLAISRRTAATWSETVRTLQVQKTVGEANEAAVAQARANCLQVEASALTLQKQIREQENSLCLLLGTELKPVGRGTLAGQSFPDSLSVGVPLRLLDNRPDIRQAGYALQSAFYATASARAAFYPQITLSGSAGWTNNSGAGIVNPGDWLLNALGSLVQPLFSRGRNVAGLRIAKAQQEEALVTFRQSLLKAGAEVNDALTRWQTARGRLAIDREQIEASDTAAGTTWQLMQNSGEATYLEVLTARQALLQAELTEVQDRFDEIQAVISLYHALGGGSR